MTGASDHQLPTRKGASYKGYGVRCGVGSRRCEGNDQMTSGEKLTTTANDNKGQVLITSCEVQRPSKVDRESLSILIQPPWYARPNARVS